MNYAIVRFFNIYGPGQKDHFIDEFCRRVLNKGDFSLNGDDTRSFCYVSDAVYMLNQVVNNDCNILVNIGRNSEEKISTVARLILELLGLGQEHLIVNSSPKGSVSRRCPDISLYEQIFGNVEFTDLKVGLTECLRSYT